MGFHPGHEAQDGSGAAGTARGEAPDAVLLWMFPDLWRGPDLAGLPGYLL